MKKLFLSGLLFLIVQTASAAIQSENILTPDEAFKLSAQMVDDGHVRLDWEIAEGYYLYQDQIRLRSQTPTMRVLQDQLVLPAGEEKYDKTFGQTTIYTQALRLEVPLANTAETATPSDLLLKVRYQGCLDQGLCYRPQEKVLRFPLVGTPSDTNHLAETEETNDFVPLNNINLEEGSTKQVSTHSNETISGAIEPNIQRIVSNEAAKERVEAGITYHLSGMDQSTLLAQWDIPKEQHLYRSQISFSITAPEGIKLGEAIFPIGETIEDSLLGSMHVYRDQLSVSLPLETTDKLAARQEPVVITTQYRVCSDEERYCHAPTIQTTSIDLADLPATATPTTFFAGVETPNLLSSDDTIQNTDYFDKIQSSGFFGTLLLFFGVGLLLAFTPCIFPMIPILSGIVVGQGSLSVYRALLLSSAYIIASAMAYALIGVAFGIFGANLQSTLQHPIAISLFVALFVVLALSMFGFYELQMPAKLQTRLNELSNRQQGGSLMGAAIMGFLSTLIVGPCVAPPLAGALTYIAQTKDALLGGLALFCMGLGMGMPLLAVGTSAGQLLPRAGAWMDTVKAIFGILMLGMAIWMLDRIVPIQVTMALTGTLLVASGIHMGALDKPDNETGGWGRFWRSIGLILLLYGATQFLGVATGSKNLLQPLKGVFTPNAAIAANASKPHTSFQRIKRIDDLDRFLQLAQQNNQAVMLDFYADWCKECIRMEKNVFADPQIAASLNNLILLQADVTAGDRDDLALQQHLGVVGPPTLLFFNKNGQLIEDLSLIGYEGPEGFAKRLQKLFNL